MKMPKYSKAQGKYIIKPKNQDTNINILPDSNTNMENKTTNNFGMVSQGEFQKLEKRTKLLQEIRKIQVTLEKLPQQMQNQSWLEDIELELIIKVGSSRIFPELLFSHQESK